MMLCYSARLFLNALNVTTETFRKESKATDSTREEREMGKVWKEWRLDTSDGWQLLESEHLEFGASLDER